MAINIRTVTDRTAASAREDSSSLPASISALNTKSLKGSLT